MSGRLRFARVTALPSQLTSGTIYMVQKSTDTVDLVFTSEDGQSVRVAEGFTKAKIEELCRVTKLTGLATEQAVQVVASDSISQAIGKLQAQATLFGQGVEGQAIYSATEFTSVPSEYKAPYIIVTQPHLRMMVWNGARYVRAPWHQPGMVVYGYGPALNGFIPVRADIVYQQANYPDLMEYLGFPGTGTFSLIEARGEFIRALDNGRGRDINRGIRTHQGDAGRNLTGNLGHITPNSHTSLEGGGALRWAGAEDVVGPVLGQTVNRYDISLDASRQWPVADEFRVSNVALPVLMSF